MSDPQNASLFNFESKLGHEAVLEFVQHAVTGLSAPDDGGLRMAVEASGLATYHWVVETDEIVWSPNAMDVLGADVRGFSTGRAFATFLDPDNFTSRYDTVMRSAQSDDGAGVPFQIEYKFRPEGRMGRSSVWLEDQGRWFGGQDGRPVEVFGTVRRIDDRHMRDQHLSFLGNCDPLTGMMNRGRMMEALGGAMSVAGRDGTECAFVIAAINNLSVVNDAYGFEVADEVIINMGRRLRHVVRTGDAIARYSGSKFGLILNNCTEDDLAIAAERFLSVARESVIETERGPVWALLSIGTLILPKHASDPNMAVARAEEALTEARKLPSDGYVVYKPSQQRSSERTLNAHSATEIVRCLREERFRLAFQPVVDATSGVPAFHEALLRMTDQAGEIVAAGHLIPIAEKLGLVRLIDRAVVQMTVAALNKYPDARLSFNISGTTATDPRWYPQIIEILASNRNVTDRLIVEITETVALGDLRETIRFVEQLRELGCGVAIDDFGAGYTSFRNLRAMPVDVLKLDGTFCSNLSENGDNQYYVRSLIDLARTFGIRTVAEWVENEADAALLRDWKVDMMQGNYFGDAQLDPPWAESLGSDAEAENSIPFTLSEEDGWVAEDTGEVPEFTEAASIEESGTVPLAADEQPVAVEAAFSFDAEQAEDVNDDLPIATELHWATEPADTGPLVEEPLLIADALDVMEEVETVEEVEAVATAEVIEAVDAIDVEAELEPASAGIAADAEETVVAFEESLSGELAKLRAAIAALDQAFKRQEPPAEPEFAEPSLADLISDTALQRAS